MRVLAHDGSRRRVGRVWLLPRVTLTETMLRARRTGGGDPTQSMCTYEQRIKSGAAAGVALGGLMVLIASWVVALVALPFTVAARLLHLAPWTLMAQKRTRVSQAHRWRIHGWRQSSSVLAEIRGALDDGRRLPE